MVRPFQVLQQVFDFVVMRKPKVNWFHLERLLGRLLRSKPETQKMIDYLLEGISGAPRFLLKQLSDIVVES